MNSTAWNDGTFTAEGFFPSTYGTGSTPFSVGGDNITTYQRPDGSSFHSQPRRAGMVRTQAVRSYSGAYGAMGSAYKEYPSSYPGGVWRLYSDGRITLVLAGRESPVGGEEIPRAQAEIQAAKKTGLLGSLGAVAQGIFRTLVPSRAPADVAYAPPPPAPSTPAWVYVVGGLAVVGVVGGIYYATRSK